MAPPSLLMRMRWNPGRESSGKERPAKAVILRFVQESVRRAPRRKALIIAAIAMGSAVATAMLGVMLDIGDKINHELRNAGANILVTPQNGYIAEADVPKVKAIFWAL